MDRRTALERLDAVRPGSDDLRLPEMAAAAAFLSRDEATSAEFGRRQSLDGRISAAMKDVPIPAEAKQRLLARLASSSAVIESRPALWNRRRVLAVASTVAATFVVAAALWSVFDKPLSPVTVAEARAAAASLLAGDIEAERFDLSFDSRLPDDRWISRLNIQKPPAGLLASDGDDRAAAWEFKFRGRLPGVLIAIPRELVETPPAADSIFGRDYLRVGASESVAWADGDFVYVLAVNGSINEFIQELEPPAV